MDKKPVIGILSSRIATGSNSCGRHFANDSYVKSIFKTGGLPVIIPICEDRKDLDAYISMCDGILIPGGEDVNPLLYHEEPLPQNGESSIRFDRFQIYMVRKAEETGLPMLGICRGIQLMNIAAGGTLYQDVSLQPTDGILCHQMKEKDHGEVCHTVMTEKGSRLYGMFGKELAVNSFHHQSVKKPGEGYHVTARAKDGTVEGIEREGDIFCLGVQWHPEIMFEVSDDMYPLFRGLVEAAEKRIDNG